MVSSRIDMFKQEGSWHTERLDCYARLAKEFNFLYFPRFVETEYRSRPTDASRRKFVSGYRSNLPGMRMPFTKRYVHDLNAIKPLTSAPLLYCDPSLGAGDLEHDRGCPAWCSFCRLTYAQKPFRQRTVPYMVEYAREFQRNTGSVELSPFGPDFPMATNKKRLIAELLKVNSSVDATAMRIDDFTADPDFIQLQALGGMDSATLGLEGNSQRMRDLVGKGVSDQEVIEAVARGIRAGLRKFKFFMITNLPGEEPEDVMKIVNLARKLVELRDELGQPQVLLQFSWTPLLIEAGTPFQWFAPTPPDHTLMRVAEQFRDIKVQLKIGTKAEPNKIAFFQLCQRASREVGEAIADVLDHLDTACWGGVPRDMRELLESALRAHGFNGFEDCFDERDRDDLFGWEFIDTGISGKLLWDTYAKMRDFAVYTQAEGYDEAFDGSYHGSEWIGRCDERCHGKTCGVCDGRDLELRRDYIKEAALEDAVDPVTVTPVDQGTVASRVRLRVYRREGYRYASGPFFHFLVRRAAYRVCEGLAPNLPPGVSIAKNTVAFASDALTFKDWTTGADYLEFGVTRPLSFVQAGLLLGGMALHLHPWLDITEDWKVLPSAASMRRDPGTSLYTMELPRGETAANVRRYLAEWDQAEYVKLVIKTDSTYFGFTTEEVNAKGTGRDGISDVWLIKDGSRFWLRMLLRGRVGPYQAYAVLAHKASWIDAAAQIAERDAVFARQDDLHGDLFDNACETCGLDIPAGLLGESFHERYCPRCLDECEGRLVAGAARRLPV